MKKQQRAETAALATKILETNEEIVRLEAQVFTMKSANQRRGVELAKRISRTKKV